MTKSSVDKSRSRYGAYVTLRFHKPIKTYHLTCIKEGNSILLAKFTEVDGDLAIRCWETIENLFQELINLNDFAKHNYNESKQIISNLQKDKSKLIRLCEEFHLDWHKVVTDE